MPYTPPILVDPSEFGQEDYKDLCEFIREKVEHIDKRLYSFRNEILPEYVRLYKGRPKNERVDWPWEGASNLQIQLIGTFCDELLSRIMGGIYMYDPLWTAILSGDTPDKEGEDIKNVYQNFLMDMAYDPAELDLYRVEQGQFKSGTKYGTGVIYFPWEYQKEIEYVYVGGGETSASAPRGEPREFVSRDCPHPEMVPLNRWGFDPDSPALSGMKFFYHIDKLDLWDVKNLPGKSPYYKQRDIDEILLHPDAQQESEMELELNESKRLDVGSIGAGAARWYVYTCNVEYQKDGKIYKFIAKYHKNSRKVLFVVFNNLPKNMVPYEDCKLAYDEESYLGTGFAELLHIYQKELSNNWNWRTNNRNYAMLGAWRISPESKLASILDLFPGVGIPAKKDEVEWIKTGADVGYNNDPDMFVMSCAKERAGVDPATGGTGGGIVNPKRGIYSAAGTSMVLAQQNNRNNLRTSDMRSAHTRLGSKLGIMYARLGIGDKLKRYGDNAEKLTKALKHVEDGTLGLRLRPTSASLNKELERQNDILLSDRLERFYQTQAQMIEAMLNPQCPPPMKQYFGQALVAGRVLMQALLRGFGKDNIDAYLPKIEELLAMAQAPQGPQQARGPASLGGGAASGGAGGNQNGQGLNTIPTVPRGAMAFGGLPAGAGSSTQSI